MSMAPVQWKPNWRMLLVMLAMNLLLTLVLLNVLCNGGKPKTRVEEPKR